MIGLYDSGYGGLTTLRAVHDALPNYDFVYLGDSGRAPYGGLPADRLLTYAEQGIELLSQEGCRLIIVACHTISCVALRHLQNRYVGHTTAPRRILGVTIPAAEAAVAVSSGHIGVIGTERTVASGTFTSEIAKLSDHRVTEIPAPLLASIVEEGWETTEIACLAVERYVKGLHGVDTLVLGCTHYPLLAPAFERSVPTSTRVLDPAAAVACKLQDWLDRHQGFVEPGTGDIRVLCTGSPETFRTRGERFLGRPVGRVAHVAEGQGRLTHRTSVEIPRGQIVRPVDGD